jgi:hypothetical protein
MKSSLSLVQINTLPTMFRKRAKETLKRNNPIKRAVGFHLITVWATEKQKKFSNYIMIKFTHLSNDKFIFTALCRHKWKFFETSARFRKIFTYDGRAVKINVLLYYDYSYTKVSYVTSAITASLRLHYSSLIDMIYFIVWNCENKNHVSTQNELFGSWF